MIKTALIYTLILTLVYAFVEYRDIKYQLDVKTRHIEALQADSVDLHEFFIQQSNECDDFYIDWINFKNKQ